MRTDLGYGSESAFSNALEREVGQPPLHYRLRVASGAAAVEA